MKIKTLIVTLAWVGTSLFSGEFTLFSEDLLGQLTKKQEASSFGCDGGNHSPELHWAHAPSATKSFAITVYDPDAPTGSGWWHWIVFNLPASTQNIPSDFGRVNQSTARLGVQSMTDFGSTGFGGACPPKGDKAHRYIFTIHALDVDKLDLDEKASPALVGFMLHKHSLAQASLISYYKR